MKLYELQIQDDDDEVFAISLVQDPAIESDFIFFNKENLRFTKIDAEKRMIIGPILIPNKRIIRVDGFGEPYEVFFSNDTVKKLAQNYLKKKYTDSATLEHDSKIKGVYLVESWIKDGKLDKSNNYGLNIPEGSWIGVFKVDDDDIWNEYIKTGKVKGFSIEGMFSHKLMAAAIQETRSGALTEEKAGIVLDEIRALILGEMRLNNPKVASTYSGEPTSGSMEE